MNRCGALGKMGAMEMDLDNALGYMIEKTEQALKRGTRQLYRRHGVDITPYQWVILYRLWEEDGLSQSDLAARSFSDAATVTRVLDVMERKDLVRRESDGRDRRAVRVVLTAMGRSLQKTVPAIMSQYLRHYTQDVSPEDLATTMAVLRKVHHRAVRLDGLIG